MSFQKALRQMRDIVERSPNSADLHRKTGHYASQLQAQISACQAPRYLDSSGSNAIAAIALYLALETLEPNNLSRTELVSRSGIPPDKFNDAVTKFKGLLSAQERTPSGTPSKSRLSSSFHSPAMHTPPSASSSSSSYYTRHQDSKRASAPLRSSVQNLLKRSTRSVPSPKSASNQHSVDPETPTRNVKRVRDMEDDSAMGSGTSNKSGASVDFTDSLTRSPSNSRKGATASPTSRKKGRPRKSRPLPLPAFTPELYTYTYSDAADRSLDPFADDPSIYTHDWQQRYESLDSWREQMERYLQQSAS